MHKYLLSIINIYVPTSQRVKKNDSELKELYVKLTEIVSELKKISKITLIAGDFNVKVGKRPVI